MSKTAIILGATGLTGSLLLQKLLADDRYSKIKLFSRSPVNIDHPKIEEHLTDLFNLEEQAKSFVADQVFVCIGSTKKKTPDQEIYHQIDYGIPVTAAKLCAKNQVDTYAVMSSIGANAKARGFYLRTKGEMEEAVLAEKIKHCFVLRPSLILGDRKERRPAEKFWAVLMKFFALFMFGRFRKYRPIKAEDIAEAMIQLANNPIQSGIIDSAQQQQLADGKRA